MNVVRRFSPLGISTAIIADDSTLLDAATVHFAAIGNGPCGGDPKISIRLHWNDFTTARVGFAIRVKGSCLTLEGEGLFARADSGCGTAECSLSRAYGSDRAALAEIGETLLLFLLTRAGRVPIHAASVLIGDTAVLLAGPSGTGKSSLSFAAQRLGLPVLSEDTTYVQLEPRLRIWGWPGAIHLSPGDAPAGEFPVRVRGGRVKSALPRAPSKRSAERAVLVTLQPGDAPVLERIAADRVLERLSPAEPGFALLRPDIERALRKLASSDAWQLTLGRHAEDAVRLLMSELG